MNDENGRDLNGGSDSAPTAVSHLLRPYCSAMILQDRMARMPGVKPGIEAVFGQLAMISRRLNSEQVEFVDLNHQPAVDLDGPSDAGEWLGAVFRVEGPPSWAVEDCPWTNVVHELVVVSQFEGLIAVHAPPSVLDLLRKAMTSGKMGRFSPIPRRVMDAAFLGGDARTVHLSGTHHRRRTKADAKGLGGLAVQDSLDSGDSTYYLQATRVEAAGAFPMGTIIWVCPGKSRIAVRRTAQFEEFKDLIRISLRLVKEALLAPVGTSSFPSLAEECDSLDDIHTPYDIHAMSTVELAPNDPPEVHEAAELLENVEFRVTSVNSSPRNMRLEVLHRGHEVLTCCGNFHGDVSRDLTFSDVQCLDPQHGPAVMAAMSRPDMLAVHYASGHTWRDGQFFTNDVQNVRFSNWQWDEFLGVTITREKPGEPYDPRLIGDAQDDSLFGWVNRKFCDGILVCDDGSGEVGDFVHLAFDTDVVTLIHVKAADSLSPGRQVAAAPFEQVVAQATKNLARTSVPGLIRVLESRSSAHAWIGGVRDDGGLQFMIDALKELNAGLPVNVVIVQPHLSRRRYNAAVDSSGVDNLRLRLLETLLCGARSAVVARAGDLTVYVHDDTAISIDLRTPQAAATVAA